MSPKYVFFKWKQAYVAETDVFEVGCKDRGKKLINLDEKVKWEISEGHIFQ